MTATRVAPLLRQPSPRAWAARAWSDGRAGTGPASIVGAVLAVVLGEEARA